MYTRDATSDHHTYESSIHRDTVLRSLPTTVSVLGWRIIVHRWFCRDTVWEPACLGTSAVHHNVSICQALILLGRCGWLPPAEGNGNIELRGISSASIRVLGIPAPSRGMLGFHNDEFYSVKIINFKRYSTVIYWDEL